MKYIMFLPIVAHARFEVEGPDNLSDADARQLMLQKGSAVGSLCHQCGKGIETDLDLAYDTCQESIDEYEVERL